MASDLNQVLAAQIEALAVEADPHQRDRRLLEAAELASGAIGVSLWQEKEGAWHWLAGRGTLHGTPSAGEVEAIADGQLTGTLPAGRVVASRGGRALAAGGLAPDVDPENVLDQFDALLITSALVGDPAADADLADLLQPALPGSSTPGTHAPEPTDLADLRQLLGHLARSQDRIGQFEDPDDRERHTSALEQGVEHAGDLLLSRLGHVGDTPSTTTLAEALEALGDDAPPDARRSIEEGAAVQPLALEPGALLAMLLMLMGLDGDTQELHLHAALDAAGTTLRLRAVRPSWQCNPPGESSLAELRARSAAHGTELTVVPGCLVLNLPLTRGSSSDAGVCPPL